MERRKEGRKGKSKKEEEERKRVRSRGRKLEGYSESS
jgi:hypothetical protein